MEHILSTAEESILLEVLALAPVPGTALVVRSSEALTRADAAKLHESLRRYLGRLPAWRDVPLLVVPPGVQIGVEDDEPEEQRIADVVCPQCKEPFRLCWNAYGNQRTTLGIRSCPSGGVYDVSINCPHCNYEEEL